MLFYVLRADACCQDEVLALKKISSKMSGEVRKFWLKINKVIAFKQKVEADEARQKVST